LCGVAIGLLAPGALVACSSGEAGTSGQSGGNSSGSSGSAGSSGSSGGSASGPLAQLSDVPVGGGKVVNQSDGTKVLIVRPAANEVKAFNAACPHVGVIVNPPEGKTITCPGHGSQFDTATGALKKGPATRGLTAVPVKIEGQQIVTA
jgi:nitrite reductase/ring-hydroxylating ferredoxin subunit